MTASDGVAGSEPVARSDERRSRPDPELVPPPTVGRIFRAGRGVRLGDVRPSGRVRLDALARYLQDVAADDIGDAGFADETRWVVRTTGFEIQWWPRYDDRVELATWCSGTGAAWAERRTTVTTGGRVAVEGISTWVNLDPVSLRPAPLSERFSEAYLPATGGRTVRSRLVHPGLEGAGPQQRWPLRSTDYDLLGHVNNAVAWVAVEDELAGRSAGHRVAWADVEYRSPVEAARDLGRCSRWDGDDVTVWLVGPDGRPAITAQMVLAPEG